MKERCKYAKMIERDKLKTRSLLSVLNFITLCSILFVSASTMTKEDLLPPKRNWPYRPIFVQARSDTMVTEIQKAESIPLGVPFDFESELFRGKMLMRFRDCSSNDPDKQDRYFEGRNRRFQIVIQGQFKRSIKMSDLYVGGVFQKPLKLAPPATFQKLLNMLFNRVAPGAILDLRSNRPKVLALYAGSAQTLSANYEGEEPDITAVYLPEYTDDIFGMKRFKNNVERKRKMANPRRAEKYEFDTDHIYTIQTYDDVLDYGAQTIKLPVYGDFNLTMALGPQPMSLSAVTSTGETLYNFDIWHEKIYDL